MQYGEFRTGYAKDKTDTRIVWYGIRYIIEHHVMRQWTMEDVERADAFYAHHMAPAYTAFPYPRDLFIKFIKENNGYMPIKVETLPEGSAIHTHIPVFQITAEAPYAALCTFLETLLVQCWYPSTVATLSRRCKDVIAAAFERSVDDGAASVLLDSRLHDFGFRGCTGVEQSVLGGCAHLLNFTGTDTLSAAYFAQFALNDGRPVGNSIPATEHSVMTAWPTEQDAIRNMIHHFGGGIFATVMDSYDYQRALDSVVPAVAGEQVAAGGFWVLRPDSGDPADAVVAGLKAAETAFGVDVNKKGFKVPRGVGVIQGDGVDVPTIAAILDRVIKEGFSVEAVAFGMGGGLLQKVNRDTMSFAVKLNHITYTDGRAVDVMKAPRDDRGKDSLPGVLAVKSVGGTPMVFSAEEVSPEENMLRVVYDCGPVEGVHWETFDDLKARVGREWGGLPKTADVVSDVLKRKRSDVGARIRAV